MSEIKDFEPKILVFCTVSTGLEAVSQLIRLGFRNIVGIVGLTKDYQYKKDVSGFIDVQEFAKKQGLRYYYVDKYNLECNKAKSLPHHFDFDLIWVAGWQRLLPGWLIDIPKYGVLGVHGSPEGITKGRGRSPQNWALITGARHFHLSIFKITKGIDDGEIILSRTFEYEETDDIKLSYYKAALCTGSMIFEIANDIGLIDKAIPQSNDARYYPQRLSSDGAIDWTLSTATLSRFCRALTKPYPGIWTEYADHKLIVWKCSTFDKNKNSAPGTIDTIFLDGTFLVSCGDGRLYVSDYHLDNEVSLTERCKFNSINNDTTTKEIIDRHYLKFPNHPIAESILKLLK